MNDDTKNLEQVNNYVRGETDPDDGHQEADDCGESHYYDGRSSFRRPALNEKRHHETGQKEYPKSSKHCFDILALRKPRLEVTEGYGYGQRKDAHSVSVPVGMVRWRARVVPQEVERNLDDEPASANDTLATCPLENVLNSCRNEQLIGQLLFFDIADATGLIS